MTTKLLLVLALVTAPSIAFAQMGSGSGSGWNGYGDCRDDCSEGGPCDACPLDECNQHQWCQPTDNTGASYSCKTVPMMCCKGDTSMVPDAQLRVGKRFKVSAGGGIPMLERFLGPGAMEVEAYLFSRVKENVNRDPDQQACTSDVTATGATGFRACVARQCFGVNFIAGGEASECTDMKCDWPSWSCDGSKFFRRLWGFFSAHVQRGVKFPVESLIGSVDVSGWLMGGFTASGSKSQDSAQPPSCGGNGCPQGGTTLESKSIAPWAGIKASGGIKMGFMGCETQISLSMRACVEGSYNQSQTCTGNTENTDMKWKAALVWRAGDSPWSSGRACCTVGWTQVCWDTGAGTLLDTGSEQEPACWSALSVN